MKSPKIEAVSAVAWEFDGPPTMLCKWAQPSKQQLGDEKPSPEARKVSVRIVRSRDYNRLLRAWRQLNRP